MVFLAEGQLVSLVLNAAGTFMKMFSIYLESHEPLTLCMQILPSIKGGYGWVHG